MFRTAVQTNALTRGGAKQDQTFLLGKRIRSWTDWDMTLKKDLEGNNPEGSKVHTFLSGSDLDTYIYLRDSIREAQDQILLQTGHEKNAGSTKFH